MVYVNGLGSIIESLYLSDNLSNRTKDCNIFVNPDFTYLRNIVIINEADYPIDKVKVLLKNGCNVISRINLDVEGVKFYPYIMKINTGIMWNGRTVDFEDVMYGCESRTSFKFGEELLDCDSGYSNYGLDDNVLYFPKIKNIPEELVKDKDGNLTSIGWALHQVGDNVDTETVFKDLDTIKTGKLFINLNTK